MLSPHRSILVAINMDPKKMLTKEISARVMGQVNEQTVSEKVDQFFRHGNTFLLLELISLRREVESLREELKSRKENNGSCFAFFQTDLFRFKNRSAKFTL